MKLWMKTFDKNISKKLGIKECGFHSSKSFEHTSKIEAKFAYGVSNIENNDDDDETESPLKKKLRKARENETVDGAINEYKNNGFSNLKKTTFEDLESKVEESKVVQGTKWDQIQLTEKDDYNEDDPLFTSKNK